MKKLISILMTFALVLTIFAGCNSENADTDSELSESAISGDENADAVVLTVEGEDITVSEALFYYYSVKLSYEDSYGEGVLATDMGDGTTLADTVKEEALEEALKINLCAYVAKERGIVLDEETLAEASENAQSIWEQFTQDVIDQYGFTLEGLEALLIDYDYVTILYDEISADVTIDEEQLDSDLSLLAAQDTYLSSILEYGVEEADVQIRARHILFATLDADNNPLSDEEIVTIKAEAEDVLARVEAGEDFATLVTEYSDDPGSIESGGEYTFGRGDFVTEFEDASYAMEEPGLVDHLVETSYGFHIIEVLEIISPTEDTIANAQTYLEYATAYAQDYQYQDYFLLKYSEWLESYTTEIYQDVWDSVVIETEETTTEETTTEETTTDEVTTEGAITD
jgi:foldase protein PrsA